MRSLITDELWNAMESLIAEVKRHRGGPPPKLSNRHFFEALLYLARTGQPWRDLPEVFEAWDAVYNRFRRWLASGDLRRLFEAMMANPEFGEVHRVFIDSTIVRAHRHAAGAARKKSISGPKSPRLAKGLAAVVEV